MNITQLRESFSEKSRKQRVASQQSLDESADELAEHYIRASVLLVRDGLEKIQAVVQNENDPLYALAAGFLAILHAECRFFSDIYDRQTGENLANAVFPCLLDAVTILFASDALDPNSPTPLYEGLNVPSQMLNDSLTAVELTRMIERDRRSISTHHSYVGHCEAVIGQLFEKGLLWHHPTEDYTTAMRWYERASSHGSSEGLVACGYCYEHGLGGKKMDKRLALIAYLRAATANHPAGMFNTGVMIESGSGIGTADVKLARKWYQRSAELGFDKAELEVGVLEQELKGDFIRAMDFFHRAASKGNAEAEMRVAMLYADFLPPAEEGMLLSRDITEAFRWFEKSATNMFLPDALCQMRLALCYAFGLGTNVSITKAQRWLEISAEHDCKVAADILNGIQKLMGNQQGDKNTKGDNAMTFELALSKTLLKIDKNLIGPGDLEAANKVIQAANDSSPPTKLAKQN